MKIIRKLNIIYLLIATVACNDNEIKLLAEKENIVKTNCSLKSANHGHGIIYSFKYDIKKQLSQIDGFSDFNLISYENGLPKKAINSSDASYHIAFDYDTKGALAYINFIGKDSRGKPFEFKSKVYANAKKQAEKIDLLLPIFDEVLITKIDYDANGNMKKISLIKDGQTNPLLENLTFDDKKSPYLNTALSNVMLYFTIFSSTVGAENTTYFSNKNNALSTKIYSKNGDILYTYKYEYNADNFPTKTKVTRKANTQEQTYEETYFYDCE